MTNDHASAELPSEPDHHPTKADDQREQPSGRRPKKIIPTLLKGWRAFAFLLIALIVGYFAFHYKALSDPGSESTQLASDAPQEMDFFVSNPKVSINVNTTVTSEDFPPFGVDYVVVTVSAPSNIKSITVLMLTKVGPCTGVGENEPGAPDFSRLEASFAGETSYLPLSERQAIHPYFASTFTVSRPREGRPYVIGLFCTGSDDEATNAYLYGHLPAIGTEDQVLNDYGYLPIVLAELHRNAPDRIRDVVLGPWINNLHPGPIRDVVINQYNNELNSGLHPNVGRDSIFSDTKSYITPFRGPGEVFWTPAELSITETQRNLALAIANRQINYMMPTGQASGQDYTWQRSTYLEPVFQLTDVDALQSESNYAFLAGILFGIAGAATIASVQEIPETFNKPVWWSRRKRKRKASSQNASDEKSDSTEGERQEVDAKTATKITKSSTGLGWPSSD